MTVTTVDCPPPSAFSHVEGRPPLDAPDFGIRRAFSPKDAAFVQRALEIERVYLSTSFSDAAVPRKGPSLIRGAISDLRDRLLVFPAAKTGMAAVVEWVQDHLLAAARSVSLTFSKVFRETASDGTIREILDELKFSGAITPVQHESVLRASRNADKRPSLILLSTFLKFSEAEVSPLLDRALHSSPEWAFSVLFECHLIHKLSSEPALREIMNEKDNECLETLSVENLESSERVREQLQCLRSISYRLTLRSWVENMSVLLQVAMPPLVLQQCLEALRGDDAKAFGQALTPYLETVAASRRVCNESLYAKEVLIGLSDRPSFSSLAAEVRIQRFLSQSGERVRQLKNAVKDLLCAASVSEIARSVLVKTCAALKTESMLASYTPSIAPICTTFRATQLGSLARSTRKIELFSKKIGGEVDRRLENDLKKPSRHILNLTCSCGNGHGGMVRALSGSLASAADRSSYRFSSEDLDVPVQVTRPVDPVYTIMKKVGLHLDTTGLYNFLLKNDLCSVINLLKNISSKDPDPVISERKQALIRQAILARDPDLLNMVYAFDGPDIDKVSQEIGLPLSYVATDFDLDDWKIFPTSPFFREAVPSLHDRAIKETLHIPEEKAVEVGLCVGPEFEESRTVEQLAAVRARYHIAPQEKVVFFSSGGAALQNMIPERIALGYHDSSTPIRLIVVCGRNEAFKRHLEERVLPYIPKDSPVSMTVLGFQSRSSMAELTQLADVAVGKPGGMSSMEFLKSGTHVIFDETSFRMKWEIFNAEVVVNSGHGVVMRDQETILPLLAEALKKPKRPPSSIARIKGSEQYTKMVSSLVADAEQHGWREKRRSWHILNKKMAYSTVC